MIDKDKLEKGLVKSVFPSYTDENIEVVDKDSTAWRIAIALIIALLVGFILGRC